MSLAPPTFFQSILASHLVGTDLLPSTQLPGNADFGVQFELNTDWSFNIGSTPHGRIDFINIALHEIGHGLGFLSLVKEDGAFRAGFADGTSVIGIPLIYDRFVVDEFGNPITSMTDAERLAAVSDADGLFWAGPNGTLANGGIRPLLLASDTGFFPGLSVLHTDIFEQTGRSDVIMEECFPSPPSGPLLLCTDIPPLRSIDNVTLGILQDIGWTVAPTAVPEPPSLLLTIIGLAVVGIYCRHVAGSRWSQNT